jgi:hypothetical protein
MNRELQRVTPGAGSATINRIDPMKFSRKWLAMWLVAAAAWSGPGSGNCAESADPADPIRNHPIAPQILADAGFSGGLIVVAGSSDPNLLPALAQASNALVQGLVSDPARLESVRGAIYETGRYGRVSAMSWRGPYLPYADGMVNLLVLLDEHADLTPQEIDRVLAPSGVVWRMQAGQAALHRKDWPTDVDDWTHSRYDATGNAVSRDERVGPPAYLQWEASPRWNRSVKTSALVSTGGRIFYILDDSPFASNTRTWSLIARDAFNGIQLWRHELDSWGGARGGKKVGPVQMHRRLVARDDVVYATLGESAPVSALDAATGE